MNRLVATIERGQRISLTLNQQIADGTISPAVFQGFIISGCGITNSGLVVTMGTGQVSIDGAIITVSETTWTLSSTDDTYDVWIDTAGAVTLKDLNTDGLPYDGTKLRVQRIVVFGSVFYSSRVMAQSKSWLKGEHSAAYTLRQFTQDFSLATGPYAGAWRYALNNGVENYFGCIAVSLIGTLMADQAKTYMEVLLDLMVVGIWVSQGNWTLGQRVFRNGYVFQCTTAGQSGISDPFPTAGTGVIGNTVSDGTTVKWLTIATIPTTWTWFISDDLDGTGAWRPPDSNDSYTATLCTALFTLARAGIIDASWFNADSLFPKNSTQYYTRLETFFNLIFWNMKSYIGDGTGSPPSTIGLTQTFQHKTAPNGAAYDIQFTEDNFEVYHGFRCASWIYANVLSDATTAAVLTTDSVTTKNGLAQHYDNVTYFIWKNNNTESFAGVDQTKYYPFAVTQFMGGYYNIDVDYSFVKKPLDAAFVQFPRWWKNAVDDFPTIVEAYRLSQGAGFTANLNECMTATQELYINLHDGRFLAHHAAAYLAASYRVKYDFPPL